MTDYEILKLFIDAELVDLPDVLPTAPWKIEYSQLSYNTDGNEEDLLDGNGQTYSGDIKQGPEEVGDYVIFKLDSSCGFDYQIILAKGNEIE